eukprot:1939300-Prymnesium_polylepis.1
MAGVHTRPRTSPTQRSHARPAPLYEMLMAPYTFAAASAHERARAVYYVRGSIEQGVVFLTLGVGCVQNGASEQKFCACAVVGK